MGRPRKFEVRQRLQSPSALVQAHPHLSLVEAQIIALGVYQRGSEAWEHREKLRRSIGNCCISPGRLDPE